MSLYVPVWLCLVVAGLATVGLADGLMGLCRAVGAARDAWRFRRCLRRCRRRAGLARTW